MNLPTLLGLIYLTSEVALGLIKKSGGERKAADAGSRGLLWISIGLGIAAGIFAPRFVSGGGFALAKPTAYVLEVVFTAGLGLRWWSILTLGRLFTVDVAIASDHHLVTKGPYRFVRHPSYSGMMIAFLALAVTFQNWLSVAGILAPISLALVYRIRVEEHALRAALGATYERYAQTTKRLVPGVF